MQTDNASTHYKIIVGILFILNLVVLGTVIHATAPAQFALYFLDIGQGDSSFITIPGPGDQQVKVMIDGGPANGKARYQLETILSAQDRRVDLVLITHPQLDHFGGLIDVVKYYDVGMVITAGDQATSGAWEELQEIIKTRNIPQLVLDSEDRIMYNNAQLFVLSPKLDEKVKDINDRSLVVRLDHPEVSALFTGDIGAKKEHALAGLYDVDVDVLKVSHHGSKYSSDSIFLREVSPVVSVIEVGKNSYGHPTQATLSRLASIGANVYRTDMQGLIKITVMDGELAIFKNK